jgi:hypothetical protein
VELFGTYRLTELIGVFVSQEQEVHKDSTFLAEDNM